MILYHFTAREYLPDIARHGLWKGEIAVTAQQLLNAMWLTNDRNPSGHGLTDGRPLTMAEKRVAGIPYENEVRFPDKRAIRFSIKVPRDDRNLVKWSAWGRKRLEPSWYETLTSTGGDKARTWFLYWGTIPVNWIIEAFDLRTGVLLSD